MNEYATHQAELQTQKYVADGCFWDVQRVRKDFPILTQKVQNKPLVYFDNASTTHKPQVVIDTLREFYTSYNSNVHRGVHTLSYNATERYELARQSIAKYIGASSPSEIIFTKGTTESINLVAQSFGAENIGEGDEILLSAMEHHANIVPWQMLCQRVGSIIKVIPVLSTGELDVAALDTLLTSRTRIVSIVHVSNAIGTVNPIKDIITKAHAVGAKVLIDGAQSIAHQQIDVGDLDADFFCFSGHKAYGPTGIGVLYGKESILDTMPPYQGGGDMILSVSFEKTIYNSLPYKFEAGTPPISAAIGLSTALETLRQYGIESINTYEQMLLAHAHTQLAMFEHVQIVGTAPKKAGVVSFVVADIHPHDIGSLLDRDGIAIRAGHHCAQPILKQFGLAATNRISFGLYNTIDEIDSCMKSLQAIIRLFHK